ncbi:MAG: WD40 repeat domain-containing serine/threonine protein kinase [Limisphaerales bacterium]
MPEESDLSEGDETLPPDAGADETVASGEPRMTAPPKVQINAGSRTTTTADKSARYKVGKEIARGGMGAVLDARDNSLDRDVAMKVMVLELGASTESRERFIREAKVLGLLEHPNIVPIHELGHDEQGRLFYTMKKVQGRTLQAVIKGLEQRDPATVKEFGLDQLLSGFRKICDAIGFAHSRGVIHRDLKPENVMIGAFGEVLVMDWGLAKILGEEETEITPDLTATSNVSTADSSKNLTMEGAVMGSPRYMPPEQACGRTADINERSDVFSLGGILYSILTLRPPVEGDTVQEALENVRIGNITPPTVIHSPSQRGEEPDPVAQPHNDTSLPHLPEGRIPKALSAVAMRALALIAKDRYSSVTKLSDDVAAYQGGYATSAENIGFVGQLRLLVGRHKGISTSIAVAFIVLSVVSLWFIFSLNDEKVAALKSESLALDEAKRAQKAESDARVSEAIAIAEKESARRAMASTAVTLAEAAYLARDGRGLKQALAKVPDDLKNPNWRYLQQQADTSTRIDLRSEKLMDVKVSEALPSQFIAINSKSVISFHDSFSGKVLRTIQSDLAAGRDGAYRLSISRDGKRIAVGATNHKDLVILDAESGDALLRIDSGSSKRLKLSHTGRYLIQYPSGGQWDFDIKVFDAQSGKMLWKETSERLIATEFVAREDLMLLSTWSGGLRVVQMATGKDERMVNKHAKADLVDLGVNGILAYADSSKILHLVQFDNLKLIAKINILDFSNMPLKHLEWTPNGRHLTTFSDAGEQPLIALWDPANGRRVSSLLGGEHSIRNAMIHPATGTISILQSDGIVRSWKASPRPAFSKKSPHGFVAADFWGETDTFIRSHWERPAYPVVRRTNNRLVDEWRPHNAVYKVISVNQNKDIAVGLLDLLSGRRMFVLRVRDGKTIPSGPFSLKRPIRFWVISPDGSRVAAVSGSQASQEFSIYSTETGDQLRRSQLVTGTARAIAWVAGGTRIVVAARSKSGGHLSLWDAETGDMIRETTTSHVPEILKPPSSGLQFAEAGSDYMLRIRDAETLEIRSTIRVHDAPIRAMTWHPTRPILATTSEDLTLRLWDVETGNLLDEATGIRITRDLSFDQSGKQLLATAASIEMQI